MACSPTAPPAVAAATRACRHGSRPCVRSSSGGRSSAPSSGHAPADVALAWLLHQPIVTAPIIGPRTLDQLDTAMGALDVQLDADVLAQLDEIFPGPGGPAPEAYAW